MNGGSLDHQEIAAMEELYRRCGCDSCSGDIGFLELLRPKLVVDEEGGLSLPRKHVDRGSVRLTFVIE